MHKVHETDREREIFIQNLKSPELFIKQAQIYIKIRLYYVTMSGPILSSIGDTERKKMSNLKVNEMSVYELSSYKMFCL